MWSAAVRPTGADLSALRRRTGERETTTTATGNRDGKRWGDGEWEAAAAGPGLMEKLGMAGWEGDCVWVASTVSTRPGHLDSDGPDRIRSERSKSEITLYGPSSGLNLPYHQAHISDQLLGPTRTYRHNFILPPARGPPP